jgi:hypothetical protein
MVLLVDLQVLGEVVDAIGQQRDLDLGRPGVTLVRAVLGVGRRLVRQVLSHRASVVPFKGSGQVPSFRTREARREAEDPSRSILDPVRRSPCSLR